MSGQKSGLAVCGRLAGVVGLTIAVAIGVTGPVSALASTQAGGGQAGGGAAVAGPASALTGWRAYLGGAQHDSYSAGQTAITPANATALTLKWQAGPGTDYLASPIVADNAVFIGASSGWFYKLSLTTGKVLHKFYLGVQKPTTCTGELGTVDTATVTTDPADQRPTVYVAGADGYLYALRASNLTVKWKSVIAIPSRTVNNYFDWSSPTVAHGKIYIGVASNCDHPLVRARLIAYHQRTGKRLAVFYTVPKGSIGGSVWSSVAVAADGDVFATTGNGPETQQLLGDSESILKLSPSLQLLGKFQIPVRQLKYDADFGSSPALFGKYVGACDKNGIFYVLRQSTMKVAWENRISGPPTKISGCIAAAVYNGHDLFLAGFARTIKGVLYPGSVQERDPSTGKLIWQAGLPSGVIGSPSLDGGGVLVAGTYGSAPASNATYLIDAANGTILATLAAGNDFAQSAFADGMLVTANSDGVFAYAPAAG